MYNKPACIKISNAAFEFSSLHADLVWMCRTHIYIVNAKQQPEKITTTLATCWFKILIAIKSRYQQKDDRSYPDGFPTADT